MKYNLNRIAFEIEKTLLGESYYGNALYAAKGIPGLSPKERSLLDDWMTGRTEERHRLQELACRLRALAETEEDQGFIFNSYNEEEPK